MELFFVTANMGFGNLLFIYLVAHALQKKYQTPIHFLQLGSSPTRKPMCQYTSFKGLSYPTFINGRYSTFQNDQIGYFPLELNPSKKYLIQGYFQSPKFWFGYSISELIYPVMNIPPPFEDPTILVHIRRGDYLTSSIHYNLPTSYYLKALQEVYSGQNVIITSDDIAYTKTLPFESYSPIYLEDPDPEITFKIMVRCSLFVIANSTYSLLAFHASKSPTKKCVVNKKWFNDRETPIADLFFPTDQIIVMDE